MNEDESRTPEIFKEVTSEYGALSVQEGSFIQESKIIPWSSWWFPTKDKYMFENSNSKKLAPLQKYDLYVKNTSRGNSDAAFFEETQIYDPSEVNWAGLCHAWATNTNYSGMIGRRCASVVYYGQRPSVDCLDPNPSSFHLAVLNLLGLNQQSFIIDTSAGNEVWNRSIKSYRYKYFRPGTHNFTDKLEFAQIPIDAFKNDPYFMYRSTLTTSIVGVWMELTYIVASKPSDNITDSAENDIYGVIS